MSEQQIWRDQFYTCRDGLRLYVRHYPSAVAKKRPVVCLPGLTRNSRDFDAMARMLSSASGGGRNVYCVDYRGRGRSEHDPDWKNYTPLVECLDVLDFMTLKGLDDVALIGTSRGGLIAMIMAVMRPAALGAVVLNDIGPEIERDGLIRILGYVGRVPLPPDWAAAAVLVRDMNRRAFPDIKDEQWMQVAQAWFNEAGGLPMPGYDAKLAQSFSVASTGGEMPTMWPQFTALAAHPVLVLRGENSDILSAATVDKMQETHKSLETRLVPRQGHAPLLMDWPTQSAIAAFLEAAELNRRSTRAA